jgi:hypothetical protein
METMDRVREDGVEDRESRIIIKEKIGNNG